MDLDLTQAAARLGKSRRQVRYLIQQGQLPARKVEGRWRIAAADLPRSEGQAVAHERKKAQLRRAAQQALEIETPAKRYSVLDLKAFQLALPLYHGARQQFGDDHAVSRELRRVLEHLTRGCHRYDRTLKAAAYREARDAASQAVCELVLTADEAGDRLRQEIKQDLMGALAGLLRRVDRRAQPR